MRTADERVIAIDGVAGSGKSTLARQLAKTISATYLDTGAMYRAVTFGMWQQEVELTDIEAVQAYLRRVALRVFYEQSQQMISLEGKVLEKELILSEVVQRVSTVAALAPVREFLVNIQRTTVGEVDRLFVVEGRDIGTVVFPNAKLKFFVTALPEVRAERRYLQNQDNNINLSYAEVLASIIKRDEADMNRKLSPTKPAHDAVVLDSSDSSVVELVEQMLMELKVRQII